MCLQLFLMQSLYISTDAHFVLANSRNDRALWYTNLLPEYSGCRNIS
jgi:hypothetical protein